MTDVLKKGVCNDLKKKCFAEVTILQTHTLRPEL